MRPLTSSLSPDDVAELLEVSPRLIHALMEDGRLLCHVHGGEPRIPLAQLEMFFRDALLRLYRAEARLDPELREQEAPDEPYEQPYEQPEEEPVGREAAVLPRASEPFAAVPVPIPDAPAPVPDQPEHRRVMRYVPRRQIDGIVGDVKFTILQISANGLRIRHKDPLLPGTEAKLTFALLKAARSVVVRARVVWTSLARSGEERFSISGLRVIDHLDRMEFAVEAMRSAHELQPERRERRRRDDDSITALARASDDEIARITAAMQKFADDPVEASRWYSRGRFALSDENVRRTAPQKQSDREEVLGIWEYLDRQVDLEKVIGVVAWTRGAN